MDGIVEVAKALTQDRKDRLERELIELEGRIEALKHVHRPVRRELDQLGKQKLAVMRALGML